MDLENLQTVFQIKFVWKQVVFGKTNGVNMELEIHIVTFGNMQPGPSKMPMACNHSHEILIARYSPSTGWE